MRTLVVRTASQWGTPLPHFEALFPEQRGRYFAWTDSAKRELTKHRRLQQAIGLLASGKPLGLK